MTGPRTEGIDRACKCRAGYVCANCAHDIELTGGAWVSRGLVLVWEEYADAS